MPDAIDKDLVTAVKTARGGKPMQFAYAPKGAEGKLLVAKKIAPKQADALKKEVGATVVFRGRCVGVDGVLVFEMVKDPPATLMAQLKKRLKEDAGVTVPIDVRVVADAEADAPDGDGDDATPVVPPAPPPPDAAIEWKAKLAEWSPAIKAAVAAKHARAADIQKLLLDAAGLAKPGGDYAAALLRLKAAFTLASGSVPPKPPAAPTPVPAPPDDATAVAARFNAVAGPLKAALAAKGPNFAAVAGLATGIQKALKAGDAAAAAADLATLEAALNDGGGPAPALIAALDALQDAGEAVDAQVEKLQAALRTSGDDELEAIAEFGLNGVTGNHRARLIAVGMDLRRATGPAVAALVAQARPLVTGYRDHLSASDEVAACDDNPFGVAVSIRGTLVPALDRLAAALA